MTHEKFNETISITLKQLEDVLVKKGKEYSEGRDNRFHNFIQAGLKQGISKEKALMGMLSKHLVSIDDMIDLQESKELIPEKKINEKLNDALVYYLILKAMFLSELPLNENLLKPKGVSNLHNIR